MKTLLEYLRRILLCLLVGCFAFYGSIAALYLLFVYGQTLLVVILFALIGMLMPLVPLFAGWIILSLTGHATDYDLFHSRKP